MFLRVYTLLDVQTGIYHAPFFVNHEQVAIRAVIGLARDPSASVGQFPADYSLMYLGEFDDSVGILNTTFPKIVGNVAAILAQYKGEEV